MPCPQNPANDLYLWPLAAEAGAISIPIAMPGAGQDTKLHADSGRRSAQTLLEAAKTNNVSTFMNLLSRQADFQVVDQFGNGILDIAAARGHLEIAKALVTHVREAHGTTRLREHLLVATRHDGLLAVHLAAQKNNSAVLDYLLESELALLVVTSPPGLTCLHYAAAADNLESLQVALKHAESQGKPHAVLRLRDEDEATALHLAAIGHSQKCFHQLLESGADLSATDKVGETPLFVVAVDDQADMLALVLTYFSKSETSAAITSHNEDREKLHGILRRVNLAGRTLLNCAVAQSAGQCVRMLHEECPALLFLGDKEIPVFNCVRSGHSEMLEDLLAATLSLVVDDNGQMLTELGRQSLVVEGALVDHHCRTLIHAAVITRNVKVLNRLLKYCKEHGQHRCLIGCDLPRDQRGCSAMFYTAWVGSVQVLNTLFEYGQGVGAPLNFQHALLNTSTDSRSAFYIAARNGHWRMLTRLVEIACLPSTASLSLTRCMRHADDFDLTPLHVAAMHSRQKCVKLLLNAGAKCRRDRYCRSPLHYAAYGGHVNICCDILENCGAEVIDWVDGDRHGNRGSVPDYGAETTSGHKTTLHLASSASHTEVVRLLLEHGAAILKDLHGHTAFDLAVAQGKKKIVAVFLLHSRWREIMTSSANRQCCKTIFDSMPDIGKLLLNRFVTTYGNASDSKLAYDFRFLYYHFNEEEREASRGSSVASMEDGVKASNWSLNILDSGSMEDGDTQTLLTQGLQATAQLVSDAGTKLWSGTAAAEDDFASNSHNCYGKDTMVKAILESDGKELLLHPIVMEWGRKKWLGYVLPLQCANVLLYMLYLFFLTFLAINVTPYQRCPHFYNFDNPDTYKRTGTTRVIAYVVIAFCCVNLAKELAQMLKLGIKRYWGDITNYLEWVLYILALVFALPLDNPPSRAQWIVGSVALFLAWVNFILFMERFPIFGLFVVMFLKILRSVAKALLVFALFICAFGFSFYILMSEADNFRTVGRSLMMMVNIATGMISIPANFYQVLYSNVSVPANHVCPASTLAGAAVADGDSGQLSILSETFTWFFLLVFLACLPIVLINMLIGLAVGDIAQIQKDANLTIAIAQAQLILNLESKLPSRFLRSWANFPGSMVIKSRRASAWYRELINLLSSVTGDQSADHWRDDGRDGENGDVAATLKSQDDKSERKTSKLDQRLQQLSDRQEKLTEMVQSLCENIDRLRSEHTTTTI